MRQIQPRSHGSPLRAILQQVAAGVAAPDRQGACDALIDSYEVGFQNWTPGFPEEFQMRRGYDWRRYLPVMAGRIVGSTGISERFLWDVRRTQADMMADN